MRFPASTKRGNFLPSSTPGTGHLRDKSQNGLQESCKREGVNALEKNTFSLQRARLDPNPQAWHTFEDQHSLLESLRRCHTLRWVEHQSLFQEVREHE